jgi:uncharacterized protein (DUF302 family)
MALMLIGCSNNKGTFIETVESQNDFKTTISKLEETIKNQGLTHFYTINHSKNAKDANMTLKAESVVIFGNPKMGTILMNCNPSIGLDLPLRMLVTQNYKGLTSLSYTNPEYWSLKHNVKDPKCLNILNKAKIALGKLADKVGSKEN